MTRRITVSVQATICLPDDTPANDYVRAVGNYLADKLGSLPSTGADFNHSWRPGREVDVQLVGSITSEAGAFHDAQQGALL